MLEDGSEFCCVQQRRHRSSSYLLVTRSRVPDIMVEDTEAGMAEIVEVMPLWDMLGLRVAEVTPL
jgi:hypothetical protein